MPAAVCEGGGCAIVNDPDSSVQTSYWEIEGLGCGGVTGCFAKLALYGDGVGEIRWDGNRSGHCSAGPNLLPATFTFAVTSTNEIEFKNGGVPIRCSSDAFPSETLKGINGIVADVNNFTGEFLFETITVIYDAVRVMGAF